MHKGKRAVLLAGVENLQGPVGAAGASGPAGGTILMTNEVGVSFGPNGPGTLFATASNASALSSVATINVGSQTGANDAISVVDGALSYVNTVRAKLGAAAAIRAVRGMGYRIDEALQ